MRQMTRLRDGLYSLEIDLPGLRARTLLVAGEDRAVVWDTLTEPADMAALNPLLESLPFDVVYSHADWDHIHGTAGFAQEPSFVIGHDACGSRFADDAPATLTDMQAAEPGKWDAVELVAPNLTFSRCLELDLGGLTLELSHLPGHTRDCIVGWLPDWGILLAGDAVETPLPVLNDPILIKPWLTALEGWAANDALRQVIPTHGSLDGRESMDATIGYLRRLINREHIALPANIDDFYQRTHHDNVAAVKRLGQV